jgi:phosphoribosyl-AMP cyclohydrolase
MSCVYPLSPESIERVLNALAFDEKGLIPAIAQSATSGEVLMMAWMNKESLTATLTEGVVVYWSRSRRKLWRKGDTSGHTQKLVECRFDCDADCLLLLVEQTGAACHTLRPNCFYHGVREGFIDILTEPLSSQEPLSAPHNKTAKDRGL